MERNELDIMASVAPSIIAQEASRKIYVLDTNVLLHDPTSMFRFQEHIVIIPLHVLDEIDHKKSDPIIGFNAREVSLKLEQIVSAAAGPPGGGIRIRNGRDGILFFLSGGGDQNFPRELELSYYDLN